MWPPNVGTRLLFDRQVEMWSERAFLARPPCTATEPHWSCRMPDLVVELLSILSNPLVGELWVARFHVVVVQFCGVPFNSVGCHSIPCGCHLNLILCHSKLWCWCWTHALVIRLVWLSLDLHLLLLSLHGRYLHCSHGGPWHGHHSSGDVGRGVVVYVCR